MDDLVIRQQQEIETLRERVRQLEDALVPPDVSVPLEWLLTGREARVFAFLTTRDVASKSAIMQAIYTAGVDDEPEIKIVDVFVCKIRKKLKPFGVTIATVWGQGYSLTNRQDWRAAA
ncbi:winged helix-turn-helix domain-containing protein [Mesorhizobium sp. B2-3-4]|uniref:winged helix-turn-helix domain-containing protein n=1 Tax=Mesorhizobium sp. B2-3-4 TaxID=2589959 RepID=UPI00112BAF6F|nr:winged helix-turn-helix domain-containing protein [Mesorhizobium sp. B2-3-4]TPM41566.1 winged helix family transcriptional regulator [Mesorhizobium sp. B2-3-4]